jgi:hypothetical protein
MAESTRRISIACGRNGEKFDRTLPPYSMERISIPWSPTKTTSSAVFIAEVPNDLILGVHGMPTEPCHYRVTGEMATRARGARKIRIINIGLEPWEAVEMGLEVETIEATTRRKPVADYVAVQDGDWVEWLQTHRVELNAMTTPQLIEWLDRKMEIFGSGKLIPPAEVLKEDLTERTEKKVRAAITKRILREEGLDAQVDTAMAALELPAGEELARGVAQLFEAQADAEWRAHIEAVAKERS